MTRCQLRQTVRRLICAQYLEDEGEIGQSCSRFHARLFAPFPFHTLILITRAPSDVVKYTAVNFAAVNFNAARSAKARTAWGAILLIDRAETGYL